MISKILSEEELIHIVNKLHNEKKVIISTSGCFDILHAGHIMYLEEAKARGDYLVLLLNSDASVRSLKGLERPIVPQEERAQVVAGLQSVDYVCIFEDTTPCRMIERIKPNIVVKGGDYQGKHIPEMDVVSKYGGKVEYVSIKDGCSSTNIIERVKHLIGRNNNQ